MKHKIKLLEVYITNVCNLSCRGCNRFNNYNFKGHQLWANHADEYEIWSQRLDLTDIHIIGGEPTLNPDLELWAINLRRLWPNSNIMIQTNGTYIKPNFSTFWVNYRIGFGISLHDITTAEHIIQSWQELSSVQFNTFMDGFIFHTANIIKHDGHFILHNTDKHEAFNQCDMKLDHTMYQGKLYKCPSMALYPEFNNQFKLQLTDEQSRLLSTYQPLASNCTDSLLEEFILTENSSIDQCSLCSSSNTWHTAYGESPDNLPDPRFEIVTPEIIQFYKNTLLPSNK